MIEKIAKLLTLANDAGAFPAEAANAQRRATELMNKYGLELIDIKPKQDIGKIIHTVAGTKSARVWYAYIGMAASEVFGCEVFRMVGRGPTRLGFVGSKVNIESSITLFEFLVKEAEAALVKAKKEAGAAGKGMKFNDSFLKGFGSGLIDRVKAMNEATTNCTALVAVNKEVKEWVAENENVTSSKTRVSSGSAFGAGKKAASKATMGASLT